MNIKRYQVENMQQAMDLSRRELGSDAVLISQGRVRRKGLKNIFRKPVLEVTFTYDPAQTPAAKKTTMAYIPDNAELIKREYSNIKSSASSEQLEKLDNRMNSFESLLSELVDKFKYMKHDFKYDYSDEINEILGKLIEDQVVDELAHALAKETDKMLRQQPGSNATEIMEHLILEQFGKPEPILHKKFTQSVILVLGSTGVGKTTTIVKLAADFTAKQKKNIGIINTDTYRIGATEQLQTYADILGAPLQVVYHLDELDKAMEQMSDRDLIFVDTAGKRPGDKQHKEDLLEIIRILEPDDILLCLSATTSFASVREMVDIYGFVDDYKIIITKLDETKHRGSVLNISSYTKRPLAYVTTGQNVPDDIEVADVEKLTKQIVRG